jgi:hypothetical protein
VSPEYLLRDGQVVLDEGDAESVPDKPEPCRYGKGTILGVSPSVGETE